MRILSNLSLARQSPSFLATQLGLYEGRHHSLSLARPLSPQSVPEPNSSAPAPFAGATLLLARWCQLQLLEHLLKSVRPTHTSEQASERAAKWPASSRSSPFNLPLLSTSCRSFHRHQSMARHAENKTSNCRSEISLKLNGRPLKLIEFISMGERLLQS